MISLLKKISWILDKRENKKFVFLISANLIISIADILFLAALVFIVNSFTRKEVPAQFSFLPGWILLNRDIFLTGIFLLLFALKNWAGFLIVRAQYKFVYRVACRLAVSNLQHYLDGSFEEYATIDSSVHIRKISQQPIEFCHYVLSGVQQMITECGLIFFALAAIIWYSPGLFLLLACLLIPAVLLMTYGMRKRLSLVRQNIKGSSEKALQYLQESLAGYIESDMYDKDLFFTNRYAKQQGLLNEKLSDLQVIQGLPSRAMEVFAVLGLFVLIVAGRLLGKGPTGLVALAAFMAAAYKIIPGFVKIVNISAQIKTYAHTVTDLCRMPKRPAVINESSFSGPVKIIEVKDLFFSFGDRQIFSGLNASLQPGDLAVLTGVSGTGKTTFIHLLLGYLKPQSGTVSINGSICDGQEYQGLRQRTAYVKQQPFLIHDSLLRNILLDSTDVDADRLNKVLQQAGLDALIKSWPEGVKKIITENGKNLSGGQRQRVALARALYKGADLLILDEPFSELDEEAEYLMVKQLRALAASGKIVVMVSHNMQSIQFCNKNIVVDAP